VPQPVPVDHRRRARLQPAGHQLALDQPAAAVGEVLLADDARDGTGRRDALRRRSPAGPLPLPIDLSLLRASLSGVTSPCLATPRAPEGAGRTRVTGYYIDRLLGPRRAGPGACHDPRD
jgi:hypothetical protein